MPSIPFFSKKLPINTEQIEQAIAHLETQTSAELRVVVEHKNTSKFDAIARAEQLFDELNMRETQDRNGVLIYLAFKPHHLAVIGDQGIDEKVENDFWQAVYESMKKQLQLGNYTQAICDGIAQVEEQLARYFPYQANDVNELPNEMVIK